MKKIYLIGLMCIGILGGCSGRDSKMIQLKGSDTILNLSQAISEEYMVKNKGSRIAVTGGGSGVGISSLLNGTTDIGIASRKIKDKELELAKSKNIKIKEIVLGYDGITVIVNKDNKLGNLTSEQLGKIYRGEITNWNQLGGENQKIVILSRDNSSGTHEFFKEHIVRGNGDKKAEYAKETMYLPSNEAIKKAVATNKYAIGYIGMGYVDNSIKSIGVDGVTPSMENVLRKKYPIAREVYWYVKDENNQIVNKLVEFALSPEGQNLIKDEGFVPVK